MKKTLFICLLTLYSLNSFAGGTLSSIFRWRNDDGTERHATWKAESKRIITIHDHAALRLRMGFYIDPMVADPITEKVKFTLTYAEGAMDGAYKEITTDTASGNAFVLTPSVNVAHRQATTRLLTTSGDFVFITGRIITTNDTGGVKITVGQGTEIEWSIKPTRHIKASNNYYFRPKDAHMSFEPAILATGYTMAPPSPDSVLSYSCHPAGKKMTIKFRTALNKHDHFILQRSLSQFSGFEDIDTIPGGTGTNFQTEIPLPDPATMYARLKLYDAKNKESISRPVKFNISEQIDLNSFTVTQGPYPGYVDIKFSTAFEHFSRYFTVYHSFSSNKFDKSSYYNRGTIDGAGYTDKLTKYNFNTNFYSNHPNKLQHFVLAYYEGSGVNQVQKFSNVVSLLYTPAAPVKSASLAIYPNPATSGKVSFDLKGYKGKTLTATLTNLYGKSISKESFSVNATENYVLKTNVSSGTYVLNVSGEGVLKTGKVLVQ